MEYELISLDIWDTTLRRNCYHTESKYGLAKYVLLKYREQLKTAYRDFFPRDLVEVRLYCEKLVANESTSKGLDDEYEGKKVMQLWIRKIMEDISREIEKVWIEEFIDFELNHEIYISYLDHQIVKRLKKKKFKRLIFLSDYYMDCKYIEAILNQYKDQICFEEGMVSSECGYNKKSGRLYEQASRRYGIKPQKHLHIGDNRLSDMKRAKEKGIQVERHRSFSEWKNRISHRINYLVREKGHGKSTFGIKRLLQQATSDLHRELKKEDYYKLGMKDSLYYISFVCGVIEKALQNNVETVYYFTREGAFFKKIHEKIVENNVFGFEVPKAELLEISRMASFAPSVEKCAIADMSRLWSQYPHQSIEALFRSLNIDENPFFSYFEKHGLGDTKKVINQIQKDERILALFADEKFQEEMNRILENKRTLLKQYLKQKGIEGDEKRVFVVDIGWRGSIQDNLAILFPNIQWMGYYMGVFRPYYRTPQNAVKFGYLVSDDQRNDIWHLRHPYPLEMYTNSNKGSVIGYCEKQGKVEAVRKPYQGEEKIFNKYLGNYQQGVLASVKAYGKVIRTHAITAEELKPNAVEVLTKMMSRPKKKTARPFFELVYNSVYGDGKLEAIYDRQSFFQLIRSSLFRKKFVENFLEGIEQSHWPQGYLALQGFGFLNRLYNSRAREMYRFYSVPTVLKRSERIKWHESGFSKEQLADQWQIEDVIDHEKWFYIRGEFAIEKEYINDELSVLIRKSKLYFTVEKATSNESAGWFSFEGKIIDDEFLRSAEKAEVLIVNRSREVMEIFSIRQG
ncbi:MAG TPA: hypothetical protein DHN33_04300 [Eubacteriaceae bacterium]|nr:hypothetical protein [Eubacteriaceae bacterium]